MFSLVSSVVIRHPRAVIMGWLLVTAGLHLVAPPWRRAVTDYDVRFLSADCPCVIGQELSERGFPQNPAGSEIVLAYERKDGHLTRDDFRCVTADASGLLRLAAEHPALRITKIDTIQSPVIGPYLIGSSALGRDQAALSIISFNSTPLAERTRVAVDRVLDHVSSSEVVPPPGLRRVATGSAVVGRDTNTATSASIQSTKTTTIVLVIVILLVVYRSPVLATVPLVTIGLSTFASLRLIALMSVVPGLGFRVISVTEIFVVVVLFGAGTDYSLFLVARYREELGRQQSRIEALRAAMGRVGPALVASAATLIVGLGMLGFSSFTTIRSSAPTIALSLAVTLAAALTVTPAMMAWLGSALFWPFSAPHHDGGPNEKTNICEMRRSFGFWDKAAELVVTYPLSISVLCLVALAPLAVAGARTTSSYGKLADLDPDWPSAVGVEVLQRYFAAGELSPTVALVENPAIDFRSQAGKSAIKEITRRLAAINGVALIRSASRPVGKPEESATGEGFFARFADQATRILAEGRYVSTSARQAADVNHITRLEIVFRNDPYSESSLRSLNDVRATLRRATETGQPLQATTQIGLTGATSAINDLKHITTSDERRIHFLVALGIYAVLVALLRRPGISLYLVATVVFSYLAALGLTDLTFRALDRGAGTWDGLDWTVGLLLFVILVAVGEDYNILLMARVLEEHRTHGVTEGTRRAIAQTGGIISACGVIMAGTFGSMLTGSLTSLRQLGFALAVGVLLDTFLVRPILVPAFVVLIDRAGRRWPPLWRSRRSRTPYSMVDARPG
jgi:putative drug exporter of the RND superfamily